MSAVHSDDSDETEANAPVVAPEQTEPSKPTWKYPFPLLTRPAVSLGILGAAGTAIAAFIVAKVRRSSSSDD